MPSEPVKPSGAGSENTPRKTGGPVRGFWLRAGRSLLIFVLVAGWFSLFARLGFDSHHDGIMLGAAAEVAGGKLLFKEVFCQYGPLAVWIQSIPVFFFGAEVLVVRLTTVLFYGFIALLGAKIWGRFLRRPFDLIWYVCFFALCPFYVGEFHPWSSVYALFFMLLGLELQLRFLEADRFRFMPLFGSGACAAAAFLCRTPCGIVAFAAGTAVLCLHDFASDPRRGGTERFRPLFAYIIGAGIVCDLFAVYLTLAGAWKDYFGQCFSFVSGFAAGRCGENALVYLFNCLFPIADYWKHDGIFTLLPLLTAGGVLFQLRRMISARSRAEMGKELPLLAALLLALVSWHQYFPVPCVRHFWWGSLPAFGVYALVFQKVWDSKSGLLARWGLTVLLALPFFFSVPSRVSGAVDRIRTIREMVVPGKKLPVVCHSLVSKEDCAFLNELRSRYDSLPPEIRRRGVLNHTPDGLFICLLPQPPNFKHPMFVNWYDLVYPDYTFEASRLIETDRPAVLSTLVEEIPGYRLAWSCRWQLKNFRFFVPLK